MTDKRFAVAGVSKLDGRFKARFAKDMMRVKVLEKAGHTDIALLELPEAMTKPAAAAWLIDQGFDKGVAEVRAALYAEIDRGSGVKTETAVAADAAVNAVADAGDEVIADEAVVAAGEVVVVTDEVIAAAHDIAEQMTIPEAKTVRGAGGRFVKKAATAEAGPPHAFTVWAEAANAAEAAEEAATAAVGDNSDLPLEDLKF